MKAVQILMDESLLTALDRLARRQKLDRSKLVRAAIKRYLAAAEIEAWEQNDIDAYRKKPIKQGELNSWLKAQAWPRG